MHFVTPPRPGRVGAFACTTTSASPPPNAPSSTSRGPATPTSPGPSRKPESGASSPRPRCADTPALRALLTEPSLTRSEAERRLLALVRAAGLPPPRTNTPIGRYEVDFLWPEPHHLAPDREHTACRDRPPRGGAARGRVASGGMEIDLTGRTAFVTGSTQGIGHAIVARLARSGAHAVVNGRDRRASTEASWSELRAELAGATITARRRRRRHRGGRGALFARAPDVDILVNNLGIFEPRRCWRSTTPTWRRYFEVNVLSAIRLPRRYLPGMMRRAAGAACSSSPATRRS